MSKRTLKSISLVIFVLVLAFICTIQVISSAPPTGTCCFQRYSYCVTPTGNIFNYYYLESGPCP